MGNEFITVRTFENAVDAHLLKSCFEDEGISCFLIDENSVSINPLYNLAVGGIKLKIYEKDRVLATQVLADFDRLNGKQLLEAPVCPICDSNNTHKVDFGNNLGGMFKSIGALFSSREKWVCEDCKYHFKH